MARTKDFSENEVLGKAADVFTRLGYSATSLSTLTQELGVAKQSLYNAFGDKESLYLQALECAAEGSTLRRALMPSEKNGLQRLQAFFELIISECANPNHPGCMLSVGILEQPQESAIASELQRKWQGTQELLRSAIEDGQRDGSIASQRRSAELAQALMATMAGLRVMRKAVADPNALQSALRHVAEINLNMLRH
jgi:TetR/AcrR family transcriptional regulator, transcriptional repressor for nem operon